MAKWVSLALSLGLLLPACGGTDESGAPADGAAFGESEVPAGYQRFRPEPITVEPGESGLWAQWVAAPFDRDVDVVDIIGEQDKGGHHALMYASFVDEEIGFTRLWQDADQLTTRFIGGVGGEGGANVPLPEGVVFRVPKGQSLLVQTHYINTTSEPIVGRSYLDVRYEDADPSRLVAAIFSNTRTSVSVPPLQESSMTVDCVVQEDVKFVMWANHMHELGKSVLTAVVDPAGDIEMQRDDQWDYEWQSNPNFRRHDAADPFVLAKGSTLRTTCSWDNTTEKPVSFPDEMCVFFGFLLGDKDISCIAGEWLTQ